GRPCEGRGEGVEQVAGVAWQSVMEATESAARLLGLAGLPDLEAPALGLGESLLLPRGYTGHGGLLVWGTGSGLPVIPARRPALEKLCKTEKVDLSSRGAARAAMCPCTTPRPSARGRTRRTGYPRPPAPPAAPPWR